MTLASGDTLGPYEILVPIGAGGMGEVWKARDTRLNRIVAIKRLKGQHTPRFEQEARGQWRITPNRAQAQCALGLHSALPERAQGGVVQRKRSGNLPQMIIVGG